jgi:hypothetical protein
MAPFVSSELELWSLAMAPFVSYKLELWSPFHGSFFISELQLRLLAYGHAVYGGNFGNMASGESGSNVEQNVYWKVP